MARRPTPLDPYPEPRPPESGSGRPARDLGPDAIAILEGRTFMVSDALGDVPPKSVGGLVHEDTRFLSRWELTLGGQSLSLLKSAHVDYDSAEFFLTNGDLPGLRANTVALGVIRTPMHDPSSHDALAKLHPVGRLGEIDDVVDAVLYLENAPFVTGEILHVDGGQSAGH